LIPVHGMNRDQCSAESHVPRWGALVPVYATNRDRFSEMNRDRLPNGTNRDQCLSLVPIDKPNRDRCNFGARPMTHFLLVSLVLARYVHIPCNGYVIWSWCFFPVLDARLGWRQHSWIPGCVCFLPYLMLCVKPNEILCMEKNVVPYPEFQTST
jgi:hypothetical protein